MSQVIAEARQYLYRYGTITDTTIDPVDLVRDLVGECERLHTLIPGYKKPKKPKPRGYAHDRAR